MFVWMQKEEMWLNKFTFANVVKVVAIIVALDKRIHIHTGLLKTRFHLDIFMGSALVEWKLEL